MASPASATLRPGLALGAYPEREDLREGWLDRSAAALGGRARQALPRRGGRYWRFVRAVGEAGRAMADLDDARLRSLAPDLRRHLYGEGLKEPLVARAFALVREMAARRVGLRPFDVQVFGGRVMLDGRIAEMETGEGKTLAATLPASVAAMAGIPVHVVTVNDFLVARDAAWMGPVYRALGLTVGTIVEGMDAEARRAAYACDVCYCTNKQLVFDYLKDRLLLGTESRRLHLQLEGLYSDRPRTSRLLLRGLCYAIVDEADSVLVDEARTPLIISNAGDAAEQERTYHDAVRMARELAAGRDFTVTSRDRRIELTEAGRERAARLARGLGGVWKGARRRETLLRQALAALHLFERDKHYLVRDDKVQIVDEYTGRIMADRAWEGGLHQMVQAKERCTVTGRQETLARISYQRFFRRYLRLAGMTGTAREVAAEMSAVYRLDVVAVPTNRPVRRRRLPDRVYATAGAKWRAVVRSVIEHHRAGRPVLVGTRSVAASEHLSELLRAAGIPHRVLNARQDQHEAEVVAQAGQPGRVTVATNMAGRGTDIRLAPGVAQRGGLHVLATERHESRRIDRQLFGRGGRQGDPGSHQAIVSLEDELVADLLGPRVAWAAPWAGSGRPLPAALGRPLLGAAQRAAESRHRRMRRDLLKLDDHLGDLLAFSGRGE